MLRQCFYLQGLDEEGLQAYSGHLQQEFLQPDISSAKRPSRTDDAEGDDDEAEEEAEDAGPAPEDAARRYMHRMPATIYTERHAHIMACTMITLYGNLPLFLR